VTEFRGCGTARRDSSSREIGFDVACQPWQFIVLAQGILPVFCLERVYVDGSIGRLGRNIFVQRIPSDALHVVTMFGNLSHESSCHDHALARDKSHKQEHCRCLPELALYILAILSMLPIIK
jgi:hypothetical protein